jgi:hypothetical protein
LVGAWPFRQDPEGEKARGYKPLLQEAFAHVAKIREDGAAARLLAPSALSSFG